MKEKEKIDIVLRGLYEYRNTKVFVHPKHIIPSLTDAEDGRISASSRHVLVPRADGLLPAQDR